MLRKQRWLAFCRRAGATEREGEAFADLDRRYREPGRHYHTWAHVAICLRALRRALAGDEADAAREVQALELAIWFHDAVYRPGCKDNEEGSAKLVEQWASALGLSSALGRRAAALILATNHTGRRESRPDPAEALLQDIDLAVLGAGRAAYRRYEREIAREHAGLSGFREGRVRLLRELLGRPALYLTPFFRRLEGRARGNLARSLERLERIRPAARASGARGARPGP